MTTVAIDAVIVDYLKQLRMGGLAAGYREILRDAEEHNLSYSEFLKACLEHELSFKKDSRLRRLVAKAKFPVLKAIDTFDFSVQPDLPKHKIMGLLDGGFVRQHESVIFVGKPGTGKTHLAISLGVAACQAAYEPTQRHASSKSMREPSVSLGRVAAIWPVRTAHRMPCAASIAWPTRVVSWSPERVVSIW